MIRLLASLLIAAALAGCAARAAPHQTPDHTGWRNCWPGDCWSPPAPV